jgi:hypothetical protein
LSCKREPSWKRPSFIGILCPLFKLMLILRHPRKEGSSLISITGSNNNTRLISHFSCNHGLCVYAGRDTKERVQEIGSSFGRKNPLIHRLLTLWLMRTQVLLLQYPWNPRAGTSTTSAGSPHTVLGGWWCILVYTEKGSCCWSFVCIWRDISFVRWVPCFMPPSLFILSFLSLLLLLLQSLDKLSCFCQETMWASLSSLLLVSHEKERQ